MKDKSGTENIWIDRYIIDLNMNDKLIPKVFHFCTVISLNHKLSNGCFNCSFFSKKLTYKAF